MPDLGAIEAATFAAENPIRKAAEAALPQPQRFPLGYFSLYQVERLRRNDGRMAVLTSAFSWDMSTAEQLSDAWRDIGVPVEMGGPVPNKPDWELAPGICVDRILR